MIYATHEVIILLTELGLDHAQAESAATDGAIVWDETAIKNVLGFYNEKHADPRVESATAILWSRLKQHKVPEPRPVKPNLQLLTEENPGPCLCPVCKEDLAVCQGMHGWAAQYRGIAPEAIYVQPHPPRRTRKGRNTT